MGDALSKLQMLSDDGVTDDKYVNIQVSFVKPLGLEYKIEALNQYEEYDSKELFEKRMNLYHGVDANFSFETRGEVDVPDEFRSARCQLMVNPLGGTDFLEFSPEGYVGNGSFDDADGFLFRLFLSPEITRNFIDKGDLENRITRSSPFNNKTDENEIEWRYIRFDITDLENVGGVRAVRFNIVRVYA